ncbi:MAG TPA: asparagine synthase (glutamine-hydrolyzing) [Myxococcota bacterium]|nr:asparagine synthase (glutamine-hydrolyzing) [Myxococcota bacterium]
MCGIVGIHSLGGAKPIDPDLLAAMNDSIVHRGPDSAGAYVDAGRVGLAMRRLSIIDVAGGDQPIGNEDGSVQVVYNGEIYNFREVRRALEAKGHRFETHSDTEVVVHAYEEYGDDCVVHFQGMFAFALWDARRGRLLLARDRVGIKQLFFSVVDGQLLFGSEIKALLRHPAVERRLRPAAVNHYLTFLYVPEPLTMFEGIEELKAGHVLTAERGRVDVRPYWQLRYDVDPAMSADAAVHGLREHLENAVRDCLVSDVPLGAFLSGGVDSGAVVALMAKYTPGQVNTFSIGYATGGDAFDERAYARELAGRYATKHREFEMAPDVRDVAPRLVQAFDQPFADSTAIPTWYLCELTRRHVTVALSGLGGDELAAGYERHRGALLAERLRWIPSWVHRALLRPLANALPDPESGNPWGQRIKRFARAAELPFEERYFEMLAQLSRGAREALLTPELREQIELDEPRTHFQEVLDPVRAAHPLNQALYADLKLYLPGDLLTLSDRVSMAHSLEVRVPYLDHRLLEFAARIPPALKLRGMERKHLLKRAVRDLLPESFFKRRKMGFSAPLAVWFRGELRGFVEDVLSPQAVADAGLLRYDAVRRILDDHYARRANHDNVIWALVALALWRASYVARG